MEEQHFRYFPCEVNLMMVTDLSVFQYSGHISLSSLYYIIISQACEYICQQSRRPRSTDIGRAKVFN